MIRARFRANMLDPRPVVWPIRYPYWVSGYGPSYSIIVAFADSREEVLEKWPEAENLECEEVSEVTFTERFQKPEWWVS